MSQADNFPGWPKPSRTLVKRVRSVLWRYLRCRPHQLDESWLLAWEWARCEALASDRFGVTRMRWPNANEIATQFLLLALARMKDDFQLRLPYRARETMPAAVVQLLGLKTDSPALLALPQLPT